MTVKDELHQLVDLLPDTEVAAALDYVRWLLADEDTLTEEEVALIERDLEEIARGEYVTSGELKRI